MRSPYRCRWWAPRGQIPEVLGNYSDTQSGSNTGLLIYQTGRTLRGRCWLGILLIAQLQFAKSVALIGTGGAVSPNGESIHAPDLRLEKNAGLARARDAWRRRLHNRLGQRPGDNGGRVASSITCAQVRTSTRSENVDRSRSSNRPSLCRR